MSESTDHEVAIVRAAADRLDELEPLWNALQAHHASVAPELNGLPARPEPDAWRRRRARYEEWLHEAGSFLLLAELNGRAVGYAFLRLVPGLSAWHTSERIADVETLSVLPDHRGRGIGRALLDAVAGEARRAGVSDMTLMVAAPNEPARRFYERWGMAPVDLVMHRRLG
jgi:ribosomal protein S18 acetylase RimI-like enzyme